MDIREPFVNENPTSYADYLGLTYTSKVSNEHKKDFGQFFTPSEIAIFLASFCTINKKKIKILDPGCGIGILSCGIAEFIANNNLVIKEIELVAFETDLEIVIYSEKCFSYLGKWLTDKQIGFNYYLCANDFILHNSLVFNNSLEVDEKFDLVISNPPYFKIKSDSVIAIAAKSIIRGQNNIYSIFLILAAKLLDVNGQLIFITPRSFSSGSYFKLFRETFFSIVHIKHLHLFESRKKAFKRDKVLQENIIVIANKKIFSVNGQLDLPLNVDELTEITISKGVEDIDYTLKKSYKFNDLVNLNSDQKILHIPTSENDNKAIRLFKTWNNSLSDFGISISTGPVVAFRSSEFISETELAETVPLIWLNNIDKMRFKWPVESFAIKGQKKGQYIRMCSKSSSRLIPNKNYIYLRRFSSKDDKSRLIASPYFSKWLLKYSVLGIENHLNYIYRKNDFFDECEVMGLTVLLNSKLFDIYFRTFNGNINVSATELRNMPMPSIEIIKMIGNNIDMKKITNQEYIDEIITQAFKIELK